MGLVCCVCGAKGKLLAPYENAKYICNDCYTGKKKQKTSSGKPAAWNELVTPTDFNTFIGQEQIKVELQIMLQASKKHGIPVQHCLFSGGFGLGKTTLAKIFASKVGAYDLVSATSLSDASDLPLSPVVIIDEIHALRDEEWLLTVMDKGNQVILGATTSAGGLTGALRSRFVSLTLRPYTVGELQTMIKNAAKNLKYDCPDYLSLEVAKRGKTVARTALFLFKRVYDRIALNNMKVTPEKLNWWFMEIGIDVDGLDNADRAYLACLSDSPIGLQNVSAVTGLDKLTIEETVEPYLLTQGFVKRTPKGRVIGDKTPLGVWEVKF